MRSFFLCARVCVLAQHAIVRSFGGGVWILAGEKCVHLRCDSRNARVLYYNIFFYLNIALVCMTRHSHCEAKFLEPGRPTTKRNNQISWIHNVIFNTDFSAAAISLQINIDDNNNLRFRFELSWYHTRTHFMENWRWVGCISCAQSWRIYIFNSDAWNVSQCLAICVSQSEKILFAFA